MGKYSHRFLLFLSLSVLLLAELLMASGSQARSWGSGVQQLSGSSELLQTDVPGFSKVRLISGNTDELILELDTSPFVLEETLLSVDEADQGIGCQKLSMAGFASTDRFGAPQLPVTGALVGIPAEARVELVILEAQAEIVPGKYNLCPVMWPRKGDANLLVQGAESGAFPEIDSYSMQYDPQVYSQDRFEPQLPAELVMTGFVRSQRVAQLRFQPFQYKPVTGELRQFRRIRVAVRFITSTDPGAQKLAQASSDEGPFETLLSSSLLNYEQARIWRSIPPPHLSSMAAVADTIPLTFKIMVNRDGIYQVTYESLVALVSDVGAYIPKTFRLLNKDSEIAITVLGEADGNFDPGDYILFYGQGIDTKYTESNVYFLQMEKSFSGVSGKRMTSQESMPNNQPSPVYFLHGQHFEVNKSYYANFPSGQEKDVWYWGNVYAVSVPTSKVFTMTVTNIDFSAPISATLSGLFKGYAATPEHHTRVYLNNHLVNDAFWSSKAEYTFEVSIPHSYLVEGANEIKVECPLDNGITIDIPLINYFKLEYADRFVAETDRLDFESQISTPAEFQISNFTSSNLELYDITSPQDVIQLSNFQVLDGDAGTYKLIFGLNASVMGQHLLAQVLGQRLIPQQILVDTPSDLRNPTNGADYIIITHPDFTSSLQPLVVHRTSQGMRVKLIDIYDVYDEFAYGVMHPQAIHDFLAYAYANWASPAPLYVLLVGDGTYDPRNYRGFGDPTFIPPNLVPEVDPYMGETVADNQLAMVVGNDSLPDIALGRIPARTSAEVSLVVNKILSYEAIVSFPDWTRRVLFVADNQDAAGDFDALSESIVQLLPSSYTANKVYYGINYTTVNATRVAIRDRINNGVLLVNYIGHGGVTTWAGEALLNSTWVAQQTNASMLAFFVPMTCLEGSYQHPTYPVGESVSLAERYLFRSGGGAVGSWSPTGLGVATGHDFLNRRLYTAFFNDGIREVGLAALQADLYLLANSGGSYLDLLSTYLIFGDPALRLRILPKLSVTDVTVSEGTGAPNAALFTVTLSSPSESTVTVEYATSDGTATQGVDYAPTSGTLTFAPGERQKTISAPIIHDLADELDETFYLTLTNPNNAEIADGMGVGTIDDNDGPTISINDRSILEGDAGSADLVFTVTLSAESVQTISVDYATLGQTATPEVDYQSSAGSLTFAPGITSQTIMAPVLGDTLGEFDETFWVTLSQPVDVVIDKGIGVGTIINDDPPSISISDASALEIPFGTLNMVFTVTLSTPGLQPVTVNFATSDDTAIAGSDYDALSGTLTFAPGETQKTISVVMRGDTNTAEANETFLVLLSNIVNANFLKSEAWGTIINASFFMYFPYAYWPVSFMP